MNKYSNKHEKPFELENKFNKIFDGINNKENEISNDVNNYIQSKILNENSNSADYVDFNDNREIIRSRSLSYNKNCDCPQCLDVADGKKCECCRSLDNETCKCSECKEVEEKCDCCKALNNCKDMNCFYGGRCFTCENGICYENLSDDEEESTEGKIFCISYIPKYIPINSRYLTERLTPEEWIKLSSNQPTANLDSKFAYDFNSNEVYQNKLLENQLSKQTTSNQNSSSKLSNDINHSTKSAVMQKIHLNENFNPPLTNKNYHIQSANAFQKDGKFLNYIPHIHNRGKNGFFDKNLNEHRNDDERNTFRSNMNGNDQIEMERG